MRKETLTELPAGLSLAMLLQDVAAKGEVSATTPDGKPTVFGDLASKVSQPQQPPAMPGMPQAAGMAQVAGGIAATQEAQKKAKIDELLASMGQGQRQGAGIAQPGMAQPGMAQPGMAQPGMPPQGIPQQGIPQQGMARGGIAQFADGGVSVSLPPNMTVPTVDEAIATAKSAVGTDPKLVEELKRAQQEAQRGRENMPLVRAEELETLRKLNEQRAASQKQYEDDAKTRKLQAFLNAYTQRGPGGAGATYQAQKESDRQQGLAYIAQQEQQVAKMNAIRDLQEAQKQGNREEVVKATERLINLGQEDAKNAAGLAGHLFTGRVQLFNSELDFVAARLSAEDAAKLARIRAAENKAPTGDTLLIMQTRDDILKKMVKPGQVPTPEQRIAAMAQAVETVRPAVSTKAGTAADTMEARKFKDFAALLQKDLSSLNSRYAKLVKAKNDVEAERYRAAKAREIGRTLDMTEEQIDRALSGASAAPAPSAAPTAAPAARMRFDAQGNQIK